MQGFRRMKLTAVIHNRRTTSSPSQNPLPAAFDRLHSCSRVYGINWQCVDRSCRGGIVQSSPHNAIAMLNRSLRDPRATLLDKMSTATASIATQSSFASVQMLVSESFKLNQKEEQVWMPRGHDSGVDQSSLGFEHAGVVDQGEGLPQKTENDGSADEFA
ncbi:hypothetical protein QC761_0047510 [Podospora bellae-mahoneyi]|uniref:Uncharacterized protein n=1 Tax=Podospora bellae-mahoneyi TaxID=2093777 RepID=A0ABR0FMD8_9PEZI|nr:hypothetical protein QC761_0047510 [Podospora bellae-mahoneyi]